MNSMEEKEAAEESNIELPEKAKKLLDTMIHNVVEDFLKTKEWQGQSEGTNN